ncbi:choice-of-anchor Q domain-containing protein [Streptomyces sp. YIM 103828]|uniref:choice-of-anchor Q domain-containing protein n=1 Tax=Streptomyces sp. YIM 103828 TaxID=3158968 RepID=UPI0032D8F810
MDVTYDHNIYFGGKTPETKGPHDLTADPLFTAPGKSHNADFRLSKDSPAIASGTPFPSVTTDFTGTPRKEGAPDRGAYSFGAAAKAGPGAGGATATGQGNSDAAMGPGTETSTYAAGDDTSGLAAQGGSEPLAETGGSDPVLPLSIAAGVLTAGAAVLVLGRRRRS